jgi:predicted GIY-YIG superfamily endonuclease
MQVYLLHFQSPISPSHTTQHYIGWAEDLESRITAHRNGRGARLCQVAKERGISFTVVRTWQGDRKLERQLKNRKNAPRLCPVCNTK